MLDAVKALSLLYLYLIIYNRDYFMMDRNDCQTLHLTSWCNHNTAMRLITLRIGAHKFIFT